MTPIWIGEPSPQRWGNGLSPIRPQAIVTTKADIWLTGYRWTKFTEMMMISSFKEICLKMSSAKSSPIFYRPQLARYWNLCYFLTTCLEGIYYPLFTTDICTRFANCGYHHNAIYVLALCCCNLQKVKMTITIKMKTYLLPWITANNVYKKHHQSSVIYIIHFT